MVGEGYEWEALNPLRGFGTEGASKLFDGLIRHDATLKAVPALAAKEHRSADYRTVTMPSHHPVTGDPAVRRATNLAVNRQGMIDALLAGRGVPASTPVPAVLDSYVEPAAQFPYDPVEARRILDAAGWILGADGIRARDGQPARFTLMYSATDTVRKGLAQAVVSDAKAGRHQRGAGRSRVGGDRAANIRRLAGIGRW